MIQDSRAVLVLLSGGQDSTTALCWAISEFGSVRAVSFDFGQVHKIELQCAARIAEKLNIPHQVIDVKSVFAGIQNCALLCGKMDSKSSEKFPATFVPGRNLLFLSVAATVAFPLGIRDLVIGVSEADYSGYPDCREPFIQSVQSSISLAMDEPFRVHAPFLHTTKADEVLLMQKLGHLDLLAETHTCYRGLCPPCGECDACKLRAAGFQAAGIADPLLANY